MKAEGNGVGMAEKPLLKALSGEEVWPPPAWLMRQAGRYLPEYREVRAKFPDFVTLCTTPEAAAEVTLQPLRRFGMDAAILFSDILILPWALGWGLRFSEGEGPVMPQWGGASDTDLLDNGRCPGRYAPVMETVRRVSGSLAPEQALIGFAGGPFTVACYMVEGGGSRDHAVTRYKAYTDPVGFSGLIEALTEATIAYLAAQIDSGADAVMIFDSWAGVLPPSLFKRYVIEPTRRIVSALRGLGHATPVIGFPRLASSSAATYAQQTGIAGVGLDTSAPISQVRRDLPRAVAIQGNLDPIVLKAGGRALIDEVDGILRQLRGGPAIFNLGHGILPETPVANVDALMTRLRAG